MISIPGVSLTGLGGAVVVALAVCGVLDLGSAAWVWVRARYTLTRTRGWRVVRRWYAPGSSVLVDGVPGDVADVDFDPRQGEPWVLVYVGVWCDQATWHRLSDLAPAREQATA